jgi:uncharacterized membrane protein YjjB (DUF3815 family)
MITILLLQALFGFTATAGFAILFNVPRNRLLVSGLIGAVGHTLRFGLREVGLSNELATFLGALLVGLVGVAYAKRVQQPRLIFTVTGIISMVPGIPAYEVIFYFSRGDIIDGLTSAVRATLAAGAIAAGLSTARILTETEWTRFLEGPGA